MRLKNRKIYNANRNETKPWGGKTYRCCKADSAQVGLTAVGGLRHPQHTQISSKSSTIAADSSNGMTNTRCYRYSCLRSWWWVEVPPETCRAVSR